MTNLLNNLATISQKIGNQPEYVQGAGGNISFKTDNNNMYIKATGLNLCDIQASQGICLVNFNKIAQFFKDNPLITEQDYISILQTSTNVEFSPFKPSMETGFHAILGNAVIHTHSIYVNTFLCSIEGPSIIKNLFPKSEIIDFYIPGHELTLGVLKKIDNPSSVYFLRNHGIIVSSETLDDAYSLHESITMKLKNYLSIKPNDSFTSIKYQTYTKDINLLTSILFPDQIMYLMNPSFIKSKKEIISAVNYILYQINKQKWTPNFLTKNQYNTILNLDLEKRRKAQFKT
jgi:rhamnose utilization protein RhaD (predicted bifunctional aldolase and dehydrogenase)